jgi:hypothetical protein
MAPTEPHPPAGHEPDTVASRGVVIFLAGMAIAAVAVSILIWGVFRLLASDAKSEDRPLPPNVAQALKRVPPAPRLEDRPLALRERLNAQETERLGSYGWVDKSAGTVHIPIERAIDLVAQRGIPDTPPGSATSPTVDAAAPVEPLPPAGSK